jgi:hypothetical protein
MGGIGSGSIIQGEEKKIGRIGLEPVIKGSGEVKGYTFERLEDRDGFYIYAVKNDKLNKIVSYEVFRKKTTKVFDDFKKKTFVPNLVKEVYPNSKSFGISAWECGTLERAQQIIDQKKNIQK